MRRSDPARDLPGERVERVHLIVLIHGLYGNPSNLAVVKEELERASSEAETSSKGKVNGHHDSGKDGDTDTEEGDEVDGEEDEVDNLLRPRSRYDGRRIMPCRILVLKSFEGSHTWDGIDINAQRAAKEIDGEISRLAELGEDVGVFSIMGYSLGGLVARYLVGILHARTPSFFDEHRPGSFSTFATPHVGVLRYGSRINTIVHTVGRRLFSRSGKQLYRIDHTLPFSLATSKSGMGMGEKEHRSLLDILADPDHVFLEALALFPRIQVVANGCNDLTVPYPTGAISLTDPFVDHQHQLLDLGLDEESCIEPDHPLHPDQSHTRSRSRTTTTSSSYMRNNPGSSNSTRTTSASRGSRYRKETERAKSPHRFPPIFYLPLPWPFNLLGFVVVPFLLPVFLTYAFITFWLHTRQSDTRTRAAGTSYHEEHTPLLSRAQSRARTPPPPTGRRKKTGTASHSQSHANIDEQVYTDHDDDDYTQDQDKDQKEGVMNRIPLLLDPEQRRMIHNLNRHLPQMERVITWWPWCFNTHAMLVVRSAKRFAYQEEGRGVVRRWAEWAIDVDVDHQIDPYSSKEKARV